MRDIKYLGLGLMIGIFGTAIIFIGLFLVTGGVTAAAVASAPVIQTSPLSILPANAQVAPAIPASGTISTIVPPTSAPTNTITPPPTATTAVIEQMLANGDIFFTGPLTQVQQILLYESSVKFIRLTTKDSKRVGEEINGVGYGSPTLICGPLTLAIMQDAGLIANQDVIPYDFWLLNPYVEKDRVLIERVFPKDRYENTLYKTPLNKFDWNAFPLKPGDFLFIKHGTGGNFDHILVINRVDSQMRAYAVTNYGTPDGFIINEVMLYDPNNPSAGIFHTWTKEQFAILGSTGFGGFEIWRLRSQ